MSTYAIIREYSKFEQEIFYYAIEIKSNENYLKKLPNLLWRSDDIELISGITLNELEINKFEKLFSNSSGQKITIINRRLIESKLDLLLTNSEAQQIEFLNNRAALSDLFSDHTELSISLKLEN